MKAFEAVAVTDLDRMDEFFAADYKRHSQSSPVTEMTSLAEFKQWLAADRESFPDSTATVDLIVAEGDLVAMWGRYEGTQEGPMGPFPASGRRPALDFAGVHRVKDGRIVETWVTWDNLAGLVQLGHFQPPGAERAPATE